MTIRPADPARDAAACAAIYAPSVESTPISFELEAPDANEFARRIERYSATHQFLVAEDGGKVVGYAYACRWRERPAYDWAVEVSVYVDPARTGEGVGRALYAELLDRLRAQGFHVAVAGITLPNPASIALHERMGFEPIGALREVGWKLGAWHDVGYWQLLLAPDRADPPPPPRPPGPTT
ncbi:MAG TPA: arsinothricin resistance N-acetyltransferase ArsN1 family B [Solirubrobacterales bacterium]|nr:arsinothricin resistance N-acetyltransferase ArsN1 family B [Solirubrobacterales bacterium]